MKKVLIISTHFAPDIHVGAKRPTKFAKYLPQYGWQPVVLTKEVQHYHGIDETLCRDLPRNLPIYRVREWSPYRKKKTGLNLSAQKIRSVNIDKHTNGSWKSYLAALCDKIFFYDYPWLLPAFFTGLRLIRQQGINLIFSTYPNIDAHLVGLLLKALTDVKWVCEYRDPWTGLLNSYRPRSVVEKEVSRRLEKLILQKSDRVVAAGEILRQDLARLAGDRYNDKISVIYNGYDQEDFIGLDNVKKQDGKFVITYLGTWGHIRNPEFFLKALGNLLRKKKYLYQRIRVNFVGEVKYDINMAVMIEQLIFQENLGMIVHRIPFVPYKKGLSYLYSSDVLLLVIGMAINESSIPDWMVTSKLFEYLCVCKPILALVPPNGESARIIRETNSGEIVDPTNVDLIEERIYDMYRRYESGYLTSTTRNVEKFDRRIQTGMLVKIFDTLMEGKAVSS